MATSDRLLVALTRAKVPTPNSGAIWGITYTCVDEYMSMYMLSHVYMHVYLDFHLHPYTYIFMDTYMFMYM